MSQYEVILTLYPNIWIQSISSRLFVAILSWFVILQVLATPYLADSVPSIVLKTKELTLSSPSWRVIVWVNSFPGHALGANARPKRAEESCWLTVNGRYGMLGFVGKGFSWGIQIWNPYIDIVSSVCVRIDVDSDWKVIKDVQSCSVFISNVFTLPLLSFVTIKYQHVYSN